MERDGVRRLVGIDAAIVGAAIILHLECERRIPDLTCVGNVLQGSELIRRNFLACGDDGVGRNISFPSSGGLVIDHRLPRIIRWIVMRVREAEIVLGKCIAVADR